MIKDFSSYMNEKATNEAEHEVQEYMFFGNLEAIKRKCESILSMDQKAVDGLLNQGGHDWASDHIAVAKENVDQVEGFLAGELASSVSESKSSDALKKEILKSIVKIDDSMSYEDFAVAVAQILREEYGEHLFKPFMAKLQKELG